MSVVDVKRFIERWNADEKFREALRSDPLGTVAEYNIFVDPFAIQPLWDDRLEEFLEDDEKRYRQFPLLKDYDEYLHSLSQFEIVDMVKNSTNSLYQAWRSRQVARTAGQFPQIHQERLIHMGTAFELSKGCSVGCWFCGLSAHRLEGIFHYTSQNAKLWRNTLEVMKDILGPAAGSGICYWATEPFDNPDYERFCLDFHEIVGLFPQTTTAKALTDPERTRKLLRTSRDSGCKHNNFSVISLKMLDRVHKEFSAEELRHVLLKIYAKTSRRGISCSGRAAARQEKTAYKGYKFLPGLTIACVSGFLFNMVEKTVSLVTPCVPSDKWPLGYKVYERVTFEDPNSLKNDVKKMIVNNMPLNFPADQMLSFRSDLGFRELFDGFEVCSKFLTRRFKNHPYLAELGRMISKETKTVSEAAETLEFYAVPHSMVEEAVNLMFRNGVLEEAPVTGSHKSSRVD